MQIIERNNSRILVKDNNDEVNISNSNIVQYTGIYYKVINDIDHVAKIETQFIGIIECERSRYDTGITGIYIKPLYIWNIIGYEWLKIVNYKEPNTKYFYYPHLLMIPDDYNTYYCPLYFLNTIQNKSLDELDEFVNITKEFTLNFLDE